MVVTSETQPPISPGFAVLAVVVTFLLVVFLGGASAELLGFGPTLVLGELLIAVVPLAYLLYKRVDIKRYIGLQLKSKYVLLGVAFGAVLLLLDVFVTSALVTVFGPSQTVDESNKMIMTISSSPQGLFLVALSLFLAGVCEEFTFRGFLLTSINSKYSFGIALVASSLAFGLFHFDPQGLYIAATFVMGLILGFIYHHWHSYIVSATAHATMNLIVLALTLLV